MSNIIQEIPKAKPHLEEGDEVIGFKVDGGRIVAAVRKPFGNIYKMDWEAALKTLPDKPLETYC